MLRVEKAGKRLVSFRALQRRAISEFYDLTDFIVNSPAEFFGEVGEDVFILGANLPTGDGASGTVDIIGLDRRGACVIVVLEAESGSGPLMKGMSAAGRVARWSPEDFWRRLARERAAELKEFLGQNLATLNQHQRVIIVTEKADEDLLSTASWLRGRHGVGITCIEVALGAEPVTGHEYLSCRSVVGGESEAHSEAPPEPEPPRPEPPPHPQFAEQTRSAAASADEDRPPAAEPTIDIAGAADKPQVPESAERRSIQRRSEFDSRTVQVEYAGRRMAATLIDQSTFGLGIEMHSPLPIGSTVRVSGRVQTPSGPVDLSGAGKVRHCRFGAKAFRLGVQFE